MNLLAAILFFPFNLHKPFYADTTEPTTYVTLHADNAIETSIAHEFPFIGEGTWQLGFNTAVSLDFRDNHDLSFHLETFDGQFGFPLDIHIDNWENRISLNHLSAHSVDRPSEGPFSREWISYQTAYRIGWFRPYLGWKYNFHHGDSHIGNYRFQSGWTMDARTKRIAPYSGFDIRIEDETNWRPTYAFQMGCRLTGEKGGHALRVGGIYYSGTKDAGQVYNIPETYYGLTIGMDQ